MRSPASAIHQASARLGLRAEACSDGNMPGRVDDFVSVSHPRSLDTFARFIGYHVHECKVIGQEEAMRKMTALSTRRLGLDVRGSLRVRMNLVARTR